MEPDCAENSVEGMLYEENCVKTIDLHYTDWIGHRVQTQVARVLFKTGEDRSSHEMSCTLFNRVAANREKFSSF